MNKLLLPIVPACITFGPLFMTRIGGTARADVGNNFVFAGAAMLAVGLIVMFRIIVTQQKLIERLQSDRRVDA
jgi:hypothetical protein